MDFRQQMDMIGIFPEFDQRATPIRKDLRESILQDLKEFRGQGLPPIFGHKAEAA